MTSDPLADLESRARVAGISIRRLADEAGIAPSTWVRWKSGQHSPNLRKIRAVEAALQRLTSAAEAA
jgi:transcriptional regulator with XRE-family HTH domain